MLIIQNRIKVKGSKEYTLILVDKAILEHLFNIDWFKIPIHEAALEAGMLHGNSSEFRSVISSNRRCDTFIYADSSILPYLKLKFG